MVHLITGLPGSGKTEIARRLRSLLNGVVVNTDALLRAIQAPQAPTAPPDFSAQELDLVYSILPSVVHQLGAQAPARHIILDGTFRFARYRQAALDAAASDGHRSSVILVTAPDDLIQERLRVRNATGLQRTASNTLAVAREQYEMPEGAYTMPNETNHSKDLDTAVRAYVDGLKETATTSSRDWVTAMWSLQDNLLQWYRAIFIAFQTLLAAVAIAVLQPTNEPVLGGAVLFFVAVAGLYSLIRWGEIIHHRGLNTHYWQLCLLEMEDSVPPPPPRFTAFLDWEDEKDLKKREAHIYGNSLWNAHRTKPVDTTRRFFKHLPIFLIPMWIFFGLFGLYGLREFFPF